MRTLLTCLLVVHGCLHLLGFSKWWSGDLPQLHGATLVPLGGESAKIYAFLWLVAVVFLLFGAAFRFLHEDRWAVAALAGIVLSQALIVFAWADAKSGTVVNAVLLVPTLIALAHGQFVRRIDGEVRELLDGPGPEHGVVSTEELAHLPPPVRRWLDRSGIVGLPRAHTARLRQRGTLRTAPEARWMPAKAVQYFSLDEPGFVWKVESTMAGVLPITGRDRLTHGRGEMLIKAGSILPVVHVADEKIAHGSMLRFLGEIVWFPSAALSPAIRWEAIANDRARAYLSVADKTVSAEFIFDHLDRPLAVRAERYLGGGAKAELTPWFARCADWTAVRGVRIPVHGDVGWTLPAGDFVYYRWDILDVETNVRSPWPSPHSDRPSIPVPAAVRS